MINGINQKAQKIKNPETKNLLQLHFGGDNVKFWGATLLDHYFRA